MDKFRKTHSQVLLTVAIIGVIQVNIGTIRNSH